MDAEMQLDNITVNSKDTSKDFARDTWNSKDKWVNINEMGVGKENFGSVDNGLSGKKNRRSKRKSSRKQLLRNDFDDQFESEKSYQNPPNFLNSIDNEGSFEYNFKKYFEGLQFKNE
jgi:hypothetical protein